MRVTQIVPAAAGWRYVRAQQGAQGRLEDLPDEALFAVIPVACFALVVDEDGEQSFRRVCPDDWPSYLWMEDDSPYGGGVGYLGPGEEPDGHFRAEAIRQIEGFRERQASARPGEQA